MPLFLNFFWFSVFVLIFFLIVPISIQLIILKKKMSVEYLFRQCSDNTLKLKSKVTHGEQVSTATAGDAP